jgi:hypothetical protein
MAERYGEKAPVGRGWWVRTLGIEAVSIVFVWMTARAFYG